MARITKLEAELVAMKARNQCWRTTSRLIPKPIKPPPSEFDSMTDEQLREHIKSLTGVAPKGNPSRKTLIRMAQEQKGNVAAE